MAKETELSEFGKRAKQARPVENHARKASKPIPKLKPKIKSVTAKPKVKTKTLPDKPVRESRTKKEIKKDLMALNNAALVSHGQELIEHMKTDSVFEQNRQQIEQYSDMFTRSVQIANIFENKLLRPSEGKEAQSRDVYALLKVYTEIREIIADMKALQDVNEYTERLDSDVLSPLVRGNAEILLTVIRNTEKHAKKFLSEQDAASLIEFLHKTGKNAGVNMQDLYDVAKEQTHKSIVGG